MKSKQSVIKYCNIVMTSTDIVTVSGHNKKAFYGYSIFTEEFTRIPINECICVNNSVFKIVRNHKAQLQLAMAMASKDKDAAGLIGITPRTMSRRKTQFKL